jgi:circadian clock protein KaiC
VITGERGQGTLTRHGLEEYISDCVILLGHRVAETVVTGRLRVVKYRGSTHGTNEYPFLSRGDRHFGATGDVARSESIPHPMSEFLLAFPAWTPCSAARAIFAAAAF